MAFGISEQTIEEIKARTDLADLIAGYGIQVKRAGGSYKACCPFHHEKTPSFNIQPSKGFYHCFGCGESGDVIKFVMKYEGLGFVEAAKKLAEAAAIRAPQADSIASYLNSHPYIYKVVCGDLNDIPFSYTHQVLTRDLHDVFTESGRGFGISYHANKLLFRIDHLLVSEAIKTKNCTIDDSIQASDHYPIWAYVEKN